MSVDHYENFPVASWLCPPALRPPIVAIYRFARTADDIADEGEATLDRARRRSRCLSRRSARRRGRSAALAALARGVRSAGDTRIAAHRLPLPLLADLLDAFAQDALQTRYADRVELLDYCRRSANPIGRLLLHLYGVDDARALAQSDAICSALQLANFWQDLGVDAARGRLYVPPPATRCATASPSTSCWRAATAPAFAPWSPSSSPGRAR